MDLLYIDVIQKRLSPNLSTMYKKGCIDQGLAFVA